MIVFIKNVIQLAKLVTMKEMNLIINVMNANHLFHLNLIIVVIKNVIIISILMNLMIINALKLKDVQMNIIN